MQKISKIIGLLTAFLLFGASLWTVFNWQLVVDYASVYDFTPDQEVKALVTDSGMSEKGKFHFYSSYPKITDAEEFNSVCQRQERSSPILGCYVPKTNRIFIYNVDNQDLKGIKEVTAAHEMLHVAYSRLSQRERDWLEPRLEAAYSRLANDKLRTRVDYYAKAEPGEKLNELHSILPTEYADLGQELNDYYAKYFKFESVSINSVNCGIFMKYKNDNKPDLFNNFGCMSSLDSKFILSTEPPELVDNKLTIPEEYIGQPLIKNLPVNFKFIARHVYDKLFILNLFDFGFG